MSNRGMRVLIGVCVGVLLCTASGAYDYELIYAVNCGAGEVDGFSADAHYADGNPHAVDQAIDMTGAYPGTPMAVYQSNRWFGADGENNNYTFTGLTPGYVYLVRMHFAEIWFEESGQRYMAIDFNGERLLDDFDIFEQVGSNFAAMYRLFYVAANSEGEIIIETAHISDNPKISGIEILAAPPVVNGSFEADPFPGGVGYWEQSTMTGWTKDGPSGWGFNRSGDPWFISGWDAPHGNQVLFVQGTGETSVFQTLQGLEDGTSYGLSFYINVRAGNPGMDVEVQLGNEVVMPQNRFTTTPEFQQINLTFDYVEAEMGDPVLTFVSSYDPDNDVTYVLDHVRILDPTISYSGDQLAYETKVELGLDPFSDDTSGDGVPDWWYLQYYSEVEALDPTFGQTVLDVESGFTVRLAYQYGFDPHNLPDDLPMIPAANTWALLIMLIGLSLGGVYLMLRTRRRTAM